MSDPTPIIPLLTTKEAARYMNMSPGTLTVWRCTKRYNLKYIKLGRSVRYQKTELDAFMIARLITR